MTIETSHGKARPTLPRSSDLAAVDTVRNPTEGRTPDGRFAPGNPIAMGARWKAGIKRLLGKGATDAAGESVARQAWKLYLAVLRELPSDGPTVRMNAALQSRHAALAAYFTNRAAEVGLDTAAGAAALDLATRHGQRAERLSVTTVDLATKLAKARPAPTRQPFWLEPDDAPEGT